MMGKVGHALDRVKLEEPRNGVTKPLGPFGETEKVVSAETGPESIISVEKMRLYHRCAFWVYINFN